MQAALHRRIILLDSPGRAASEPLLPATESIPAGLTLQDATEISSTEHRDTKPDRACPAASTLTAAAAELTQDCCRQALNRNQGKAHYRHHTFKHK